MSAGGTERTAGIVIKNRPHETWKGNFPVLSEKVTGKSKAQKRIYKPAGRK